MEHQVSTVQEMGWTGIKNGELLKRANSYFQVFVTGDKNLRYQQNLKGYELAFVILPSNRIDELRALSDDLVSSLLTIQPGQIIEL